MKLKRTSLHRGSSQGDPSSSAIGKRKVDNVLLDEDDLYIKMLYEFFSNELSANEVFSKSNFPTTFTIFITIVYTCILFANQHELLEYNQQQQQYTTSFSTPPPATNSSTSASGNYSNIPPQETQVILYFKEEFVH